MAITNSMGVSCLRTMSPQFTMRPLRKVLKCPSYDPFDLPSLCVTHAASTRMPVLCSSSTPIQQPVLSPIQQEGDKMVGKEMEEQIFKIRDELSSFDSVGEDVTERLSEALNLVDLIQRLGIQRFFKPQINKILNLTYMQWKEESGLEIAGDTVLGFRLLRLHGYHVSADVLKTLRDENGDFSCFSLDSLHGILGILNLYKCSQLGFPTESVIMKEANYYARDHLSTALSNGTFNLRTEIKFALDYPRRCLLPRLESRSIVRQLWPGDGQTKKYLELAKFDLQMLQKLHQQEMEYLKRWWTKQGFEDLNFAREGIAKCFFAVSPTIFEPQFSASRMAFAKTVSLTVILDDLFEDNNSNTQELQRFTEAVRRWDPSQIDDLPQHKVVFRSLYNTVLEMAGESSKAQGRELLPFFKELWKDYICAFLKETEWNHSHHVPMFEDYLKLASFSIGGTICTSTSLFLMGESITDEIIQRIGRDSRFMYLVEVVARLSNDLVGFEREARQGKKATAVGCYLRDNPQCTKEEAISSLSCLIESSCEELELELYQSRAQVPECLSRVVLNFARTSCFTYKIEDGFTDFNKEYMQLFQDYLFDPLP